MTTSLMSGQNLQFLKLGANDFVGLKISKRERAAVSFWVLQRSKGSTTRRSEKVRRSKTWGARVEK